MKKLLTLVLLLGLATVTQATVINFTVDGSTSAVVSAGDVVTVELKADTACSGWSIGAVASSIVMADFGSLAAGAGFTVGDGPYEEFGLSGLVPSGLLFDTYNAYHGSAAASGAVLLSFDVKVPTDWNGSAITIAPLAEGTSFDVMGYGPYTAEESYGTLNAVNYEIGGVTLTPEPITLTLLGLGGLALVRRRRA